MLGDQGHESTIIGTYSMCHYNEAVEVMKYSRVHKKLCDMDKIFHEH